MYITTGAYITTRAQECQALLDLSKPEPTYLDTDGRDDEILHPQESGSKAYYRMPTQLMRSLAKSANKSHSIQSWEEPINWIHKDYYGGTILTCDGGSVYLSFCTKIF